MTITFYVNWDAQEIYRNEEELLDGYLRNYAWGKDMHFNEYLAENYEADTLFYATEEKKKEILERYNKEVLENAKDWAIELDMINTIEI